MIRSLLLIASLAAIILSPFLVGASSLKIADWSYYRFQKGDRLDKFPVWYFDQRPANRNDYNDIQREFYGLDQVENNEEFQVIYFRNRFSFFGHIAIFDKDEILIGTASIYE